uniref:Transmembrane protein 170A n=1 Tax=Amphiprion percula TaxID=161767 RepID=A0A3P8TT95_AMPPE
MQDRYNEVGFVQQILGLNLVPRRNGTHGGNDTSLSDFSEMWYGVFLWAAVSSLMFHLPAALISLVTLRQHKMARFMPIAILLMGIVGPVLGGVLTSKLCVWNQNYSNTRCEMLMKCFMSGLKLSSWSTK